MEMQITSDRRAKERSDKHRLRVETSQWQKAAIGLFAVSLTLNMAQYARIIGLKDAVRADEALRQSEAALYEKRIERAQRERDIAIEELRALTASVEVDKQAREAQAAAEGEVPKLNLNPTVTAHIIEDCTITYYCAEKYPHICGLGIGITATGAECDPGHIVAVDPNVIPLHSKVIVDYGDGDLHCYFAEDVGGSVKGNHIDVMCETHDEALNAGKTTATVYWIKQEEHQ